MRSTGHQVRTHVFLSAPPPLFLPLPLHLPLLPLPAAPAFKSATRRTMSQWQHYTHKQSPPRACMPPRSVPRLPVGRAPLPAVGARLRLLVSRAWPAMTSPAARQRCAPLHAIFSLPSLVPPSIYTNPPPPSNKQGAAHPGGRAPRPPDAGRGGAAPGGHVRRIRARAAWLGRREIVGPPAARRSV